MAAKITILATLKRLEHARDIGIPIVNDTQQKSLKQLLETLIANKKLKKKI